MLITALFGNSIRASRRPGGIERPARSCAPAGRATIYSRLRAQKRFVQKSIAFHCLVLLSYSEL